MLPCFSDLLMSKSSEEQHRLRRKKAHEFLLSYIREQSGGADPEKYFRSLMGKTRLPHVSKCHKNKRGKLEQTFEGDEKPKTKASRLVSKDYLTSGAKNHSRTGNRTTTGSGSRTASGSRTKRRRLISQEIGDSSSSDESDTEKTTLPPIREGKSDSSGSESECSSEGPKDELDSASQEEIIQSVTKPTDPMQMNLPLDDDNVYTEKGAKNSDRVLRRERISKTAPVQSSRSLNVQKERDLKQEITKMKYRGSITSAQNSGIIQAFLRQGTALHSSKSKPDSSPRCHTRAKTCDVNSDVMRSYEAYRGLTSRAYAVKCMNLATSFREKPWLQQVRQATAIAHQGVRKTLEGKPHLFTAEMEARNTTGKHGLSTHNPIPV